MVERFGIIGRVMLCKSRYQEDEVLLESPVFDSAKDADKWAQREVLRLGREGVCEGNVYQSLRCGFGEIQH